MIWKYCWVVPRNHLQLIDSGVYKERFIWESNVAWSVPSMKRTLFCFTEQNIYVYCRGKIPHMPAMHQAAKIHSSSLSSK